MQRRAALVALASLLAVSCSDNRALDAPPQAVEPPSQQQAELSTFLPAPKSPADRPAVLPRFAEVARESGIDFTFFNDAVAGRYFLPEVMGGGAAWLDFDCDGRLDLYLANGAVLNPGAADPSAHSNRLFSNRGAGQFVDVTSASSAGDRGYGQGLAVGDYDVDGFADIYIANYGANVLLHNNGDGTFSDVTENAGVADQLWSSSPVWLDLNGDALLDLYVVNYLDVTFENSKVCEYDGVVGYCGPGSYQAVPDRAYLSQGDGAFIDATEELGLVAPGGKGLAVAALDFDNDLAAEIYVANDMMENFLFTRTRAGEAQPSRDGGSQYFEVAVQAGCAVSDEGLHEASMGLACADFDGDQLFDIFVTHYYAAKNTLYQNLGGLTFFDDSRRTRIAAASYETLGFGTAAFDYDLDGAVDLFIANGHVLGPRHTPNAMPPQLLKNDGRGGFADISEFGGAYFQNLWLGRGAAGGDYDDDGDLDLAVTHIDRPAALLRNDTKTENHWIGFELSSADRLPPVGGRIVVKAAGRQTSHPVIAGGSYLCSSDPRILAGLGDYDGPVEITVYWPTGQTETHQGLAVDRYWRVVQGQTPAPRRRSE